MNVAELLNSGKFEFGKLCRKKHDHSGKSQSLRRLTTKGCKECELNKSRKAGRERYRKNKEKASAEKREYNNKNRDKVREIVKRHYYKHRERLLQIDRERYKEKTGDKRKKECLIKYPLDKQIAYHRTRARRNNCKIENYSLKDVLKIFDTFKNECAYCGSKNKVGIDHYVPLHKKGEEALTNLIPCCRSCNSSKRISDGWEWYSKQEFFTNERYIAILKSTGIIG